MLSTRTSAMSEPAANARGGRRVPGRGALVAAVALAASLGLVACSSSATPAADKSPAGTSSPAGSSSASKPANAKRVTVTWFVGLGTGADQGQPTAEKKVVDAFNASQTEITLKMNVVANKSAADTLATQVAGGNAPDIVGPVGIKGANQFDGQWLNLAPLIQSQKFDTSIYDAAQLSASRDRAGAQTALPFGVYPSFIWFNKELFDEANLPYPPQKFGEKYADGREWNTDTLRDIAKKLTTDASGNDATGSAFDPTKVVQWGFDPQFGEEGPQYNGALFGAGSFVGADGKTAQIPAPWLAEWKWYYDMIWKDHSAPSQKQLQSDTLNKGNAFETGKVGMAFTHTWYLCCMKDSKEKPQTFWDLAANPSYKGKITDKLHSDTFRVFKSTKHPGEAFKVLSYFLTNGAPELLKIYNAMPANQALQAGYFKSLDATWTQGVNWQVAVDALQHPDIPNHEGWMPNFNKSNDRIHKFGTRFLSTPGLNIDAEAAKVRADLQTLFAAAK